MVEVPADLKEGALFLGRYKIGRQLGRGGMGAVYSVTDMRAKASRALKVMLPMRGPSAERLQAQFLQEAQIVGPIESDHVAKVFDYGIDETSASPFIVMELLRGDNLDAIVKARGRIEINEALEWLRQTALGLDKVHAQGVVHRDLKPENLFLTKRDDGSPCVKIVDFGIARDIGEQVESATQTVFCSPHYVAPEQLTGKIARAVDIFALSHIAYTLLVGKPYRSDEEAAPVRIMQRFYEGTLTEPPVARAARLGVSLPRGFDDWFACGTHYEPARRPATAADLVEELHAACGVRHPRSSMSHYETSPMSRVPSSALAGGQPGSKATDTPSGAVPASSAPSAIGSGPHGPTPPLPITGPSGTTMQPNTYPAPPSPPRRRGGGARWAGIAVAALLAGGIGIGGWRLISAPPAAAQKATSVERSPAPDASPKAPTITEPTAQASAPEVVPQAATAEPTAPGPGSSTVASVQATLSAPFPVGPAPKPKPKPVTATPAPAPIPPPAQPTPRPVLTGQQPATNSKIL